MLGLPTHVRRDPEETCADILTHPAMRAPRARAGKNLQAQYERWQPRAKYKTHLDPTMDDVKKLAVSCRRSAKVRGPCRVPLQGVCGMAGQGLSPWPGSTCCLREPQPVYSFSLCRDHV